MFRALFVRERLSRVEGRDRTEEPPVVEALEGLGDAAARLHGW